jgi:hypothetical protein
MKTVAAVALLMLGTAPAWAGRLIVINQIPTLEEGGLVALVALIGVVGGLIARRRKK